MKQLQRFWKTFIQSNPKFISRKYLDAYHFCDNEIDANELLGLVLEETKQATAPLLRWFELRNIPLPKVGDLNIVTDWEKTPKAIVETTKVELVPFNKVTAEFAFTEGEGDKSLIYWQNVHKSFYQRDLAELGETFSEDMIVVCEYFQLVYPKNY